MQTSPVHNMHVSDSMMQICCMVHHAFQRVLTACLPVQVSWGTKSGFYLKSANGTARSYIQVCERLWQPDVGGLLMVIRHSRPAAGRAVRSAAASSQSPRDHGRRMPCEGPATCARFAEHIRRLHIGSVSVALWCVRR